MDISIEAVQRVRHGYAIYTKYISELEIKYGLGDIHDDEVDSLPFEAWMEVTIAQSTYAAYLKMDAEILRMNTRGFKVVENPCEFCPQRQSFEYLNRETFFMFKKGDIESFDRLNPLRTLAEDAIDSKCNICLIAYKCRKRERAESEDEITTTD